MYFVVFFFETSQYKVVPYTWISGSNLHLENFINNGVNSNRDFYVFWTDKIEAFDRNGYARADYSPNLNAGCSNKFPAEGWYRCRIRKFKSMYKNTSKSINFSYLLGYFVICY